MSSFKTKAGTELPIQNLRGKPYLQVAYRLVWFREEKPEWSIATEYVQLTPTIAIAKATVSDAQGRVIATGHKTETPEGFQDFVEKAETGAIGRALAACGYGTQFAPDLDEGERVVDSPIATDKPAHALTQRFSGGRGSPECCGKPMMISKFNTNELYCVTCKSKRPKDAA